MEKKVQKLEWVINQKVQELERVVRQMADEVARREGIDEEPC